MKVSGIYGIHNELNGKWYIGQSTNLKTRIAGHTYKLDSDTHHNIHLTASYKKYGKDAFKFIVLELCDHDMLDIRESAWISYYNSTDGEFGFNNESGGVRNKYHSSETLQRLSLSHMGNNPSKETRAKMSASGKGRIVTEATRAKISSSHVGIKPSLASRQKMSESHAGKKKGPCSDEHKRRLSESRRRFELAKKKELSNGL